MSRTVQPELLDSLPHHHPHARASRRDLRLIHAFMGTQGWFARELRTRLRPGDRLLEIGAGEGDLLLSLRHRGLLPPNLAVTALDLAPRPPSWPSAWAWRQDDLAAFSAWHAVDVVLVSFLLHHFEDAFLAALGAAWQAAPRPRLLVVQEPARSRLHQVQLRLLYPFGLHAVTRHDARVSISAGFRPPELPAVLGLDPVRWNWTCRATWSGACRLLAHRRPDPLT